MTSRFDLSLYTATPSFAVMRIVVAFFVVAEVVVLSAGVACFGASEAVEALGVDVR